MNRSTLNTIANVFGVAFLLCVGIQVIGLGLFLGLHDGAYSVHSRMFALSPQAFDTAAYATLALMKALGLTLFLAPWAALKLVAWRAPADASTSPTA